MDITSKTGRRAPLAAALRALCATALVALVLAPAPALADDSSTEVTNDEVLQAAPLEGSATTEGLPDGQVQVTVTATDATEISLPGHLVQFEAPEGWELVSGSLKSGIQTTEAGATQSTTAVFQRKSGSDGKSDDGGKADGSGGKSDGSSGESGSDGKSDSASGKSDDKSAKKKGALPSTGDTAKWALVAVACASAGFLLVVLGRKLRLKGMTVIIVTVVMVAVGYPVPMLRAFADDAGSDTVEYEVQEDDDSIAEARDTVPVTAEKTLDLTAGDITLSVDAKETFMVEGETESTGVVNVDTSNSVASDATSAFVIFESTTPFVKTDVSKKEGKAEAAELSGEDVGSIDSSKISDLGYFDGSKMEFGGILEGATLRGNPVVFKTTEDDDYQDTLDDGSTTHYEMWCAVDDINTDLYSDDDPYGYVNFTEGSFETADDDTYDTYTGMACVKFVNPDPYVLRITSKDDAIGTDTDTHTFDNGEFFDGTNKFRVGVDLDNINIAMPVRDDVAGYDSIPGEPYTIDGVEGHSFKQLTTDYAIEAGLVTLLHKDGTPNVNLTSIDWSDTNMWLEFAVEDVTGQEAYDAFTEALARGVRIDPLLTSAVGHCYGEEAYPEGTDAAEAAEGAGFGYAESNPTALVWATGYKESGDSTQITYLASVQDSSDIVSDDTVAEVDVVKGTTLKAEKAADTSDMEITSAKVADAGKDVIELTVSVPTSVFNESLEALGLSAKESGEDEVLSSLYSYVSGINLTMSDGSSNAFGVSDTDKQVDLVDGAALASGLGLTDEASAQASTSTPKTAASIGDMVDQISDDIDSILNDKVKKSAETAAESGKKIFESIQKIIKAYNESGGASLSMLGPVGSIIGAAVSFIDIFDVEEETTTYSINDVMNKLDKLESTVNGIAANTSVITLSLQEMDSSIAYSNYASRLGLLHGFMSGSQTTKLISTVQEELSKYKDTTDAHNVCTLATPIANMPDEAVTVVRKFVTYGNKYAKLQTGSENAEAALNELYNMITGNGFAHTQSLVDAYFNYTENFYNWESETYTARLAFVATISQMWLNAYMIANADVALQAYDLDKSGTADAIDQADKVSTANKLQDQTVKVSETLYGSTNWDQLAKEYPNTDADSKVKTAYDLSKVKDGQYKDEYESSLKAYEEDGDSEADAAAKAVQDVIDAHYFTESSAAARTHSDGTGRERLLVVDASTVDPVYFSTTYTDDSGSTQSYYAKTSAYDKTCFANAYIQYRSNRSSDYIMDEVTNSWSANSSFKAWQVQQMVKRINALPSVLRPTVTVTDDDGNETTRAIENVAEELQALGFKSVDSSPSTNYKAKLVGIDKNNSKNYKLTDALAKYGVVDAGTAENPTPTSQETDLDKDADENQNWRYIMTRIMFNTFDSGLWGDACTRQNYWIELGSSSERLLSASIGDRIQNSGDWVITQTGDVQNGARNKFAYWHSKARYGTVVNYKTGVVKENQFLYTVDAEFNQNLVRYWQNSWWKRVFVSASCWEWMNRVEFYGFGVFDLTAKTCKIDTGEGQGAYGDLYWSNILGDDFTHPSEQYQKYYRRQLLKSTWRSASAVEGNYWSIIGSDGELYPTTNWTVNKSSRDNPTNSNTYAK